MENFYQESGRCGRDGKYAESILLFRLQDMFKISTMTFMESNGQRNAYAMIEYCINSKKCRRDQFAKYFSEVWDDKNCGKMCESCYSRAVRRSVLPPKMDLVKHYKTLVKIVEKASLMDTKLTALKLCDAWFHKGAKPLRLDDEEAPNIDRFYGEQIVAFLIINEYLHEDIQFTAYSTLSYLVKGVKGPRNIEDEEIEFFPSRVYALPKISELKNFYEATSQSDDKREEKNDAETVYLSDTNSRTSSTRKRKYSEEFKQEVKDTKFKPETDEDDDVIFVDPSNEVIEVID